MPDTKGYLKLDILIAVPLVAYYFITRGQLAQTTSWGIQGFYMIEVGVAVLIQLLLAVFDNNNAKAWVASLRGGAIVYMLGMAVIVSKLGLLSVWFILLFCFTECLHICMLLDQAKEKDYSGYQNSNNYQDLYAPINYSAEVNNNQAPNSDPLMASVVAQQRTNFFEQQRIMQEIQRRNQEEARLRNEQSGFEEKKKLEDKDILTPETDGKSALKRKDSDLQQLEGEKQNASEKINLQHIMELREAFEAADTDKGGALDEEEFIEAFGGVIGKGMNAKQLNHLFMKIDADASRSVEWHEFMNYMLLENQTLSSMKAEHFEYVKSNKPDPPPKSERLCHNDMITCILVLQPEDYQENTRASSHKSSGYETKKNIKFITSSRDGTVKVWVGLSLKWEKTISVSSSWVTAIQYMVYSKRLVAACANRMISFYDLNQTNYNVPVSRIENLIGIPLCIEYYMWPKNKENKLETLLIGDDLGICHMYNFTKLDWHYCEYKLGSKDSNKCHFHEIEETFKKKIKDQYEPVFEKKYKLQKGQSEGKEKDKQSGVGQQMMDKGKHDFNDREKNLQALTKKKVTLHRKEHGITIIEKQIHKGWITKIKFYPDLNYIVSSSLDGFIHIHDIEDLSYKENKTFNLHQKGVNSFVYSSKHRFVASCGEERHIIMWDPFTLGALSYLYGHNTSVQDLTINEDRHHLISLGTDKVVKIWDIRTYACIQTIFDKICYRPEDRLTFLHFDKSTNNILLGSRKINLWFFKTQEEIKTSHEYQVSFALYNTQFETVVSGDDGSFIAVWDIENGKLMSKFGDAHGKAKITAGCFDQTQRRLITTASDGSARIWNFSNGSCLTELLGDEEQKIGSEITAVCSTIDFDQEAEKKQQENQKMSHIIAVGWDKKIHIWADEKDEEVTPQKVLPRNEQRGHQDDIMSLAFCKNNQLIYTGGHDGSLIAWNLETGYVKYYLHDCDPTCMTKSGNYIKESKSVDCLLILYQKKLLLSISADQLLRFWDFDITGQKQPVFTMYGEHQKDDSISAVASTLDNNYLVTGDTSGCLKLWNFSNFKFREDHSTDNIKTEWFIMAHKSTINSIQIVEGEQFKEDMLIITASNDHNIHLFRFSNGVFIGQFGQETMWNIHDLAAFEKRRPKYVRSWFLATHPKKEKAQKPEKKKVGFSDLQAKLLEEFKDQFHDQHSMYKIEEEQKKEDDEDSYYDSDEDDDYGGVTIKGVSQYLSYQPREKKQNDRNKNVNEEKYFKNIQKLEPKLDKYSNIVGTIQRQINDFKHKYKNNSGGLIND